jgi:thiamine-phosphate pyrophosphorylase
MNFPQLPRLHLVTDDWVLASSDFVRRVERAIVGGASGPGFALHLRAPGTGGRRLWEIGCALLPLCQEAGVPLLVNDRIDLALVLGADGAHLGRRSLPPSAARSLLGAEVLLGASVHGVEELTEVLGRCGNGGAIAGGVDFVLAGSAFATTSHPGRTPIGIEGVRAIVEGSGGIPVLAIGGIHRDRVTAVMSTGAYGIALLSSVWNAGDPGEVVAALLDRIGEYLRTSDGQSAGG